MAAGSVRYLAADLVYSTADCLALRWADLTELTLVVHSDSTMAVSTVCCLVDYSGSCLVPPMACYLAAYWDYRSAVCLACSMVDQMDPL